MQSYITVLLFMEIKVDFLKSSGYNRIVVKIRFCKEGNAMKFKKWGIIMLLIGIASFIGAIANGTIVDFFTKPTPSETVAVVLMIALVLLGAIFIALAIFKKNKDK